MKISIVVLHYETIEETMQCLNSIMELDTTNISLMTIVIDNNSQKNKVDILKENYPNVIFLRSPKNLGFANGNNLGIYYSNLNFKPDYIIVVNNDVVFHQTDFLQRLSKQNQEYGVIGPKILSIDKKTNQNPIYDLYLTKKRCRKILLKYRILKVLNFFNLDKVVRKNRKINTTTTPDGYKLHGSCLIFSKKYFECFYGIFSETFMYAEEDILKYLCVKNNIIMHYEEDMEVTHKEAGTVKTIFKSKQQRKFFYKHSINSFKLLLKLMRS